jgi:hypothetical protein
MLKKTPWKRYLKKNTLENLLRKRHRKRCFKKKNTLEKILQKHTLT